MKLKTIIISAICLLAAASCTDRKSDLPVQGIIDENGLYTATFTASRDYLLIPSYYKRGTNKLDIQVNGTSIFEAIPVMTVAKDRVDYFVPIEIAPYKGKKVSISITGVDPASPILSQARQSDSIGFDREEFYRPQYHFSPEFGWNNDPNGLFYDNGVWHLGYQYNPYSVMWDNMSWGHATSTDLVHWEYHPVIIRPDALGNAYSGSAVIDKNNTAGFGENAVVALYTSAGERGQQQSVAYSLDGGYTYTKYEGNPVISSTPKMMTQRDPKVQWIDDKWVMAISFDKYVRFYGSQNLLNWEFFSSICANDFGLPDWGTWECPDLLKFDYNGETKWVVTISADQTGPNGVRTTLYFIGQWTGREFIADPLPYPLLLDYGVDQYAGVTYGNTGDRHVQLAWLTSSPWPGSETPATKYFTGGMALPHDIFLKDGGEHLILASVPAREIYEARQPAKELGLREAGKLEAMLDNNSGSYQIELTFVPKSDEIFGFKLSNSKGEIVSYSFDQKNGEILTDRSQCGLQDAFPKTAHCPVVAKLIKRDEYKVELFIDRMSSEMFVNDGDCVMTNCLFPTEYLNTLEVFGDVELVSSRIFEFN